MSPFRLEFEASAAFAASLVFLFPCLSFFPCPVHVTHGQVVVARGTVVSTYMAAVGVRSSGAGLETVFFSSQVPAIGRFEHWIRDLDRQLVVAIARDVETNLTALNDHAKSAGFTRPPLLHVGIEKSESLIGGDFGGKSRQAPLSKKDGGGTTPAYRDGDPPIAPKPGTRIEHSSNGGGEGLGEGAVRRPSIQGHLLARSTHWTAAVETALACITEPRLTPSGTETTKSVASGLNGLLASLLEYVDGWAGELRQSSTTAYLLITNTALITQALQHRDVVGELLKTLSPASNPAPAHGDEGGFEARSTLSSGPSTQRRVWSGDTTTDDANPMEGFPFVWECHLRHYYISREEAAAREEAWKSIDGGGDGGSGGYDGSDNNATVPPPPLMRIGLGPWNVPYGFEYAGTLERLWLAPLSERCLLHVIHSAKVKHELLVLLVQRLDLSCY